MGFLNLSASDRVDLQVLSAVVLVFAVICFITTIVYEGTEETLLSADFKGQEKTLGPIEIKRKNTVLAIAVSHALSIPQGYGSTSSFVEGEVLDGTQEYLFSFGKEFWAEAGYDEGNYYESDTGTSMKLTLQDPGAYYLRFKAEGSLDRQISVTVSRQTGSGLPHRVLGIVVLIAGIILLGLGNRTDRVTR